MKSLVLLSHSRCFEATTMLRKDIRKDFPAAGSTANAEEVARFNRLADEWWKPDGAFKVVHAFNAVRVAHLTTRLPVLFGRDAAARSPLAGLRLIDVGCGAGIVTEPISRLGAETIGLDASEKNVAVARRHAEQTGALVSYVHALPEDMAAEAGRFDIVLSLEVVEHVADVGMFLAAVGALVKPGGVLVIGTLNRTPQSFVKAIVGAEYVLGWLPKGTHNWRKFVRPDELDRALGPKGFSRTELVGVALNPLSMLWSISRDTSATYLATFRRRAGV